MRHQLYRLEVYDMLLDMLDERCKQTLERQTVSLHAISAQYKDTAGCVTRFWRLLSLCPHMRGYG